MQQRMPGASNGKNMYGPAAALVKNGATAHKSVCAKAAPPPPPPPKDYARDMRGRFIGPY